MTLPIHPQPLDNESMTSWLKRLAEGNGTSISNILSSYIDGNKRWDRRDLDLISDEERKILFVIGIASIQHGCETSLNRTIIGLKVEYQFEITNVGIGLNRTIIGLKDGVSSCAAPGIFMFESNYYRIESRLIGEPHSIWTRV